MKVSSTDQEQLVVAWLEAVQDGSNTMSQRKLTSIEKHAGDLEAVKRIAERMGIHLLLVETDEGQQVVAASLKPFKVIC